jgi:predicted nuclease of predicted toxin-antitoxin system
LRFLVDICAGRRLADWLRGEGHDVVEVRERGADPGDAAILRWAVQESRILVTMDKDFGTLVYRDGAEPSGMIRLPHVPASERISLLRQLLERHPAETLASSVVTVRGSRVRISRPPRREAP